MWMMRNVVGVTLTMSVLSVTALAGGLGDASMQRANRAAAEVVKQRMADERPADAKLLEAVEAADIVVVRGDYDRVEDVLQGLGLRHTVVRPSQVASLQLNARQLLIVDCPGDIPQAGIERIRKFVNAGGYLYTTDWALERVVERAFPGFIAMGGRETANDVVEVEVKETQHSLLKHLTLSGNKPKWWLEASSYPIRVLDASKVDVLITSKEMGRKYGQQAIAVHFRYGDGQVLHMVSHFYLQQGQARTLAEKQKASGYIAKGTSLAPATKKALAESGALSDEVSAGDLDSAYSAQQVTSNLVVDRKRDQARIDQLYSKSLTRPAPRASSASPALSAGTRVKELERRGDQVKVRTMEGEEAWVPASAL